MRSLGPSLILGGALAAAVAMFLPAVSFGGVSLTWWEWVDGLDIALVAACVIAAGLALAALTMGHPVARQMAGIAGAITFGFAFTPVPGAIHDSSAVRAGLWIVGGAGAIALTGALITTLLPTGRRQARPHFSGLRRRVAWIGITLIGVVAFAAMAVADPFGGAKGDPQNRIPDVNDAAKLTRKWAADHKRAGERFVQYGCAGDEAAYFEARWACHVRFEPTRRVVTVYVHMDQTLYGQRVVQVRRGEHPLPYP